MSQPDAPDSSGDGSRRERREPDPSQLDDALVESALAGLFAARNTDDTDVVVARGTGSDGTVAGALPARVGRYEILEEIGRGGMGAVFRGRDLDIGREIAIKMLHEPHARDRALASRLIDEARIGGQLEHPAIVPVHELGLIGGERPFVAMKLVQGETLARLLDARTDRSQDRQRFVGVFEQVCQAIAYAHARGVIHRDLKPQNVMVGAFGEVQVMDWGLAKVIGRERPTEATGTETDPALARPIVGGVESLAGAVLGTPAYMAPEQARGETELIDERADVFGLGSILCEILGGAPPFAASTAHEAQRRARAADLAPAHESLRSSGADPELIALALRCLAPRREDRLRDAGEVASAVRNYLDRLEERARRSELEAAEARVRATGERSARRRTLAAGTIILVLLGALAVVSGLRQIASERTNIVETSRTRLGEALDSALLGLEELERPALEQLLRVDDPPANTGALRALEDAHEVAARVFIATSSNDGAALSWPVGDGGRAGATLVPWNESTTTGVERALLDDAYRALGDGREPEAFFALRALLATDVSIATRAEATLRLVTLIEGSDTARSEALERLAGAIASARDDAERSERGTASSSWWWLLACLGRRAEILATEDEKESARTLIETVELLAREDADAELTSARGFYAPGLLARLAGARPLLDDDDLLRADAAIVLVERQSAESRFATELRRVWLPALAARAAADGDGTGQALLPIDGLPQLLAYRRDRARGRTVGFLVGGDVFRHALDSRIRAFAAEVGAPLAFGVTDDRGATLAGALAAADGPSVVTVRAARLPLRAWIDTDSALAASRRAAIRFYGTVLAADAAGLLFLLLGLPRRRPITRRQTS